jgi:hypothetical protein
VVALGTDTPRARIITARFIMCVHQDVSKSAVKKRCAV